MTMAAHAPAPAKPLHLSAVLKIAERIAPGARERELERRLPYEAFELIRDARLGALRLPQASGGAGATIAELIEAIATMAAADSNVAHALRSHFNHVEGLLLAGGRARGSRDFALIRTGRLFGGAHTERGTPRPGDIRTRLLKDGAAFRLQGRKDYSTGSGYADFIAVTAVDEAGRPAKIVLPRHRRGVIVHDDWDGIGQRLTASGSIDFDNVDVGPDEIEPLETTEAVDHAGRHAASFRQLFLAACQAGIVRNALNEVVDYVRRVARPITHSPAQSASEDAFVQRVVGAVSARSFAIDATLLAAAQALDRSFNAALTRSPEADDRLTQSAVTVAKAQAVIGDLALAATSSLFDAGGGSAVSRSLNLDRHWRNVRTLLNHNPTDHKLRVIGDHALNGSPPPLAGGFF